MRIVGWNVNGLRACIKKGFIPFLERSEADIVALQEVRAFPEQLPPEITASKDWHVSFSPAKRPGYSGVAILSRVAPSKIETSLGEARFDDEGRFIIAHFGRLAVASIYFPKGNGKDRDNSRVGYKLDFYRAVFDRLNELRSRGKVYVLGDFNTAHHGWVDTFRATHPDEPDHYTWWRQFGGAREKNVGWRIDYVYASTSAMRRVKEAFIWPDVLGSDHCPVGVDLK